MKKNILLLALGDIYWTRFALHISRALKQAGLNPIIVLESRAGEYQTYLKRCDYGNTKVYYLSDYAASYRNKNIVRSNSSNIMCDYLRVMKHGHSKKLLNTNWNFSSKCIDDFSAHVFDSEDVDLIVSDLVSTSIAYSFCKLASSRSIEFWGLSGARIPDRYVTTYTIDSEAGVVQKIYREIISGNARLTTEEQKWADSYLGQLDSQVPDYMRSARLNKLSLGKFINVTYLKMIVGSLIYSVRERKDKKSILIKSNPVATIISSIWKNIKRWFKAKIIRKYFIGDVFSALAQEKYFVYPIHYEPEASTVVNSSFYSNQLEVITNLAFSMPEDSMLVVKEHVSNFGYPDIEFYRKIESLPNVYLAWHEENIKELIRNSLGVITLTGTAGFEALLLDKPVYHFGNVFYTFHPNAIRLADWNKCKEQLSDKPVFESYDNVAFLVAYRRYTHEGKLDFIKADFGVSDSIVEKIVKKFESTIVNNKNVKASHV